MGEKVITPNKYIYIYIYIYIFNQIHLFDTRNKLFETNSNGLTSRLMQELVRKLELTKNVGIKIEEIETDIYFH
jgi:hypothetical protein